MRGADALARILKLEGVEVLFSYPNHALIDAAAKVGIRPMIARGEKTIINMADGYARATNGQKPSVIVVQAGPGIENAFGAFAQAYSDGVPLLMIPGGGDQRRGGEPPNFDPLPVYRNVTKWAGRINMPERIAELSRRAFAQLRNGKPGPVLLELPADVSNAQVDDATFSYSPARGYRSAGDPDDVTAAARMLVDARRPVLHVGHGVLWAQAWDELRELAELLSVPVMTTMAAKSAFPENHPLSLGAGGHTITRAAAQFLVRSDLVFGVGCSFARGGFSSPIPAGKKLVQVIVDGRDIDRDYLVDQAVVGDAQLVLRQLIAEVRRLGGGSSRNGAVAAEVEQAREATVREWQSRMESSESPINPYRVIAELNRVLDKSASVVTHDSGNPRDQTLTTYEATTPRGYIGWGKSTQLGTGLGIALGAKLAWPDKTVVNVMGDLAFGTVGMEVETGVRERLPIMTVILNNSVMGGYGHHMPSASEQFRSNRLSGNYARVAEGLGAHAERVERAEDVRAAMERGIAATRNGQPAVLEMITKEDPVYPVSTQVLQEVTKELVPA
jgi:acetolactate synthase-1/2/3 large subunit